MIDFLAMFDVTIFYVYVISREKYVGNGKTIIDDKTEIMSILISSSVIPVYQIHGRGLR